MLTEAFFKGCFLRLMSSYCEYDGDLRPVVVENGFSTQAFDTNYTIHTILVSYLCRFTDF